MTNNTVVQASKAALGQTGLLGTVNVLISDDDKVVTSANMKVGAYSIAAQPTSAAALSFTVTANGTADTMGTIALVGSVGGVAQSETVVPVAGSTVYSQYIYDTVTSITGAEWVIDAGSGNDTIKVGTCTRAPLGYHFCGIMAVAATTVVAAQTNVSGAIVADLRDITALPSGVLIPCKCTALSLTSGEAIAYLLQD